MLAPRSTYALSSRTPAVTWRHATQGRRTRRLRISPYGREAWAVLAIATLAVPMLTKNVWPYYYLEPFVFLLIPQIVA